MGCTVAELDKRISARELREWMVYERTYGALGPIRIDRAAALIAQTVFNMMRSGGKSASISDYMPKWDEVPEERESDRGDN